MPDCIATLYDVQKYGSTEMTNTSLTRGSTTSRAALSRLLKPDAWVACKTTAPAAPLEPLSRPSSATGTVRGNARDSSGGAAALPASDDVISHTFSSVALDGASDDDEEPAARGDAFATADSSASGDARGGARGGGSHSRHMHGHSTSCVDLRGLDLACSDSNTASTATLAGFTARERVQMLANGTYNSPRRGVSDTPLDESTQLRYARSLSRALDAHPTGATLPLREHA